MAKKRYNLAKIHDGDRPAVDYSIIFPTYNESGNVLLLLGEIFEYLPKVNFRYEIIFVDDSDDDTPDLIRECMAFIPEIRLIHRSPENRTGLSTAFVEGFHAARGEHIICMDSDLQHPPEALIRIMRAVAATDDDIVVASRYRDGGHAHGLLTTYRKVISQLCKYFAWFFIPTTRKSSDPGSGFFAVRKSLATTINTDALKGFKILIEIMAQHPEVTVSEIAYGFRTREKDESKATLQQGICYGLQVLVLYRDFVVAPFFDRHIRGKIHFLMAVALFVGYGYFSVYLASLVDGALAKVFFVICVTLSIQGFFTLFLLLYTWSNPLRRFTRERYLPYAPAHYSFTAMIPARNEEAVLKETIRRIAAIDYPDHLKEILVLIYEDDDKKTVQIARQVVAEIDHPQLRLITFSGHPGPSKSRGLNIGLAQANGDIVTIFDAEDRVQKDLYKAINTIFLRSEADVVQSGVQLMNYHSNWFSLFNVLEYYFWFKSALHFFADRGIVPLGGNTVFIKRRLMHEIGGWDADCLTEDADIGVRLASMGAKFEIFYDESLATQEQTPPTLASFIKQRTRWNQGFMQILFKGDWLALHTFGQKALILFVLTWPFMQAMLLFFLPASFVASFFIEMPVLMGLLSFIPMYVLIGFVIVSSLAIYEFVKKFGTQYSPLLFAKILIMIIPFQIVLGLSAFRAMGRMIAGKRNWEKTEHVETEYALTKSGARRVA